MLHMLNEDVGTVRDNSLLAKTPLDDVFVLLSLSSKFFISSVFSILNREVVENVMIFINLEHILKFCINDYVDRSY